VGSRDAHKVTAHTLARPRVNVSMVQVQWHQQVRRPCPAKVRARFVFVLQSLTQTISLRPSKWRFCRRCAR